jgi:hypothetical protein
MSSVYQINKGINKPIEFRGLKAQWIAYLAGGLVTLLILFAVFYIIGMNVFVCLFVIGGLGGALFFTVFRFSAKYGQYGLLKKNAKRSLPLYLKFRSRKTFIHLKNKPSISRGIKGVSW